MNFVFIPVYIHYLGAEGYGLVGLFTSLLAIISLLDLGMGTSFNREMARLSIRSEDHQKVGDLVKTLEVFYWLFSFFASLIVFLLAPVLSKYWVKPDNLSIKEIIEAFHLMSFAFFFRFPLAFYSGGLMGLQRQIPLNIINIIGITIRTIGTVIILKFYDPSIRAFFIWQIIASIIHTGLGFLVLKYYLPKGLSGKFNFKVIKSIKSFAIGMTGISILSLILSQLDKIVLSKMLSLTDFGYYNFAFSVCSSISLLANLAPQALFPKFSQLVALKDSYNLKLVYRKGYDFLAILVIPITVMIVYFAPVLILAWTRNEILTINTTNLIRGLIVAQAFQALMPIPYMLMISHGLTSLVIRINIVSIIILAPLFYFLTKYYQGWGAILAWLLVTTGYVFIAIPLIHKKLMPGESPRWYRKTFGKYFIIPLIIIGIGHLIAGQFNAQYFDLLIAVSSLIISMGVIIWSTPFIRNYLNILIK